MKLSHWAKQQGIHYNTALKWFKAGKIKGRQLDTGTILVDDVESVKSEYDEVIRLLKEIKEMVKR